MMGIAENLRARLAEVGMSQSELARQIGITQPTVADLLSGKSQGSKHLHRIARVLGTTPEKLTGEDPESAAAPLRDRRMPFHGAPPADDGVEMVEIAHIDLRYGLGGTYLDSPVEAAKRRFPLDWLRSFTDAPPAQLVWTAGDGDSMEPTIRDGDPILINLSRSSLNSVDGIWACAMGEVGMVKRLRPLPDGSVEIHSDNPNVPTGSAADGELHIIGKVIAKIGRL